MITGPNGFGKSTLIRCLNAIGSSDLSFFNDLIFDEFSVSMDTGDKELLIKKTETGLIVNGTEIEGKYAQILGKGISLKDFPMEKQHEYSSIRQLLKNQFPAVMLIQEQRLVGAIVSRSVRMTASDRYTEREVVLSIPHKMIGHIREAAERYSREANRLDSTYPERLFCQEEGITEEEFRVRLFRMKEQIAKLSSSGVVEIQEPRIGQFRSEDARALKIYFDDFDAKYQTFEALVERMELFAEILKNRFRFKDIQLSADRGLRVLDEVTGRSIPLNRLSSGEKETVVLFYTLLFEIPDGILLLIDEPEMSLHIAWQRMMAEDLKRIAEMKNLTLIAATHSPQMINGNRSIQVDLGELYKNGLN